MANAREVKGRIKSVKNISQITRALEAVSASRVRRAQDRVQASRQYAEKAWEILLNVNAASKGQALHPMLTERESVDNVLLVLITSDRGLAGSYNTNVIRAATTFERNSSVPVKYVTVGRKGRDSLIRQGKNVIAEFSDLPATPTVADISPIAKLCMEEFLSGNVDEVLIAYTDFINILTQSPVVLGWLPLTPNTVADQVAAEYVKEVPQVSEGATDYEYEPSPVAVVDEIVPRFTELQLYQALLESQASEHAARMTAMKNATDNASQLVDDLTLEYNKARQAAITSEILDIVGGAAALEDADKKADAPAQQPRRRRAQSNGTANVQTAPAPPTPKEESVAVAAVATAVAEEVAESTDPDDLTKIEGIGPKMSGALIAFGIDTFAKLADATEDDLRQAIDEAGMRFAPSLVTWAEQASFAAKGDWDGLDALQDELDGGRRVD
ncbi:MAG: ATP synthase F1 subunit gamma [Chloroflexota bacterium]